MPSNGRMHHTTLRVRVEDLEEIDQRAHDRGLSRTRYLIVCALGRDPWPSPPLGALIARVELLCVRVGTLEAQLKETTIVGVEPKTCANERCGREFLTQEGQTNKFKRTSGVKYCSAPCARAQVQREYRRRQNQAIAN